MFALTSSVSTYPQANFFASGITGRSDTPSSTSQNARRARTRSSINAPLRASGGFGANLWTIGKKTIDVVHAGRTKHRVHRSGFGSLRKLRAVPAIRWAGAQGDWCILVY